MSIVHFDHSNLIVNNSFFSFLCSLFFSVLFSCFIFCLRKNAMCLFLFVFECLLMVFFLFFLFIVFFHVLLSFGGFYFILKGFFFKRKKERRSIVSKNRVRHIVLFISIPPFCFYLFSCFHVFVVKVTENIII